MVFGALADVHGNFDAMSRAMERHPEVPFWLCVGDLASRAGEYPEPPAPLYWIKGNNENFDRIADWQAGTKPLHNLRFVANGTAAEAGTIRIAALGGTFAPTWFETPPSHPPHTSRDDKRRHLVREKVEGGKRLQKIYGPLPPKTPPPVIVRRAPTSGRPRPPPR